jgi:hypothetical protein
MKKAIIKYVLPLFLIVGCGPSAEEISNEQARMDSLKKDSIAMTETLAENIDINSKTPEGKKFVKSANLKFKVKNVLYATEKIEDYTAKYNGYLTYSYLENSNENYEKSRISRDSILFSKQIVVMNTIKVRIPNENLDSFIRELKPLVLFFDHRIIKLDEVTFQFLENQKKTERLEKFEKRQQKHIDTKDSKLKETTNAEETLLDKQNAADELKLRTMALEDQIKYCNLTIEIYQKPVIVSEFLADFEYVADVKPNFFKRLKESFIQGWFILEEIILFFAQIWGVILLIGFSIFGTKYLIKLYKRYK